MLLPAIKLTAVALPASVILSSKFIVSPERVRLVPATKLV